MEDLVFPLGGTHILNSTAHLCCSTLKYVYKCVKEEAKLRQRNNPQTQISLHFVPRLYVQWP